MITSLMGTKSHMDQAFTIAGHRVPVTVVKTGVNIVSQIKTLEHDGYGAIQLGFGQKKLKHTSKALQGHFRKLPNDKLQMLNGHFPRYVKEVKTDETFKAGSVISPAQVFKEGDLVKVTGISKGKGFAGGIKRWGFAGGPKTHGQSDRHRAPGSIGQGTTPGRVHKGKKMAGRMGQDKKTIKNLTVLKVDDKNDTLWLSGAVAGNKGGILLIEKIGENKKFQPLYTEDISEEVIEKAMEAEAELEAVNKPQIEGEVEETGGQVNPIDKGNKEKGSKE